MSEYSDFPRDFLIRTKKNLDVYSGDCKVTNLINNCLGLIIIPKELLLDNLPDYFFDDNDKTYGISKSNISYERSNNFKLKNVIRHIRNGLAHGRIEQKSANGKISGIRIFDRDTNNSTADNFSIEMTIDEFQSFAIKLSDDFVSKKNHPNIY